TLSCESFPYGCARYPSTPISSAISPRVPKRSRSPRRTAPRIGCCPFPMRFLFHTLGCTLPPAFVLFLLVDTAVNPNVPRFGTTLSGPGPNGSLSLDESRELLALSRKLVAESKDEEALKPALKLYAAYPRNHIYTQTLAQIYQRLGRLKEETQYWEKFLQD